MGRDLSLRTVGLLVGFTVLLGAAAAGVVRSGADIVVLQLLFVAAVPVLFGIVVRDLRS